MKPKSRKPIFLIGYENNQILGAKLPSNRQVLSVLFYNMRNVYLKLHESARLVIKEVGIFWEKSSIPMRQECRAISKLEQLYDKWRNLEKNQARGSKVQRQNEKSFVDTLDDLFDIAHGDAMELIKSEETKQFLIAQRQTGRDGCLMGVDRKRMEKEQRIADRLEKERTRKEKYIQQQKINSKCASMV